jgi:anti-sigma factor RsiW
MIIMEHESCRRLLESLSGYVDHDLDPEICLEIERHLAGCENCQVVINTLQKTVELYHQAAPDAQVPDDVRKRLYMRLDLDDYLT